MWRISGRRLLLHVRVDCCVMMLNSCCCVVCIRYELRVAGQRILELNAESNGRLRDVYDKLTLE